MRKLILSTLFAVLSPFILVLSFSATAASPKASTTKTQSAVSVENLDTVVSHSQTLQEGVSHD